MRTQEPHQQPERPRFCVRYIPNTIPLKFKFQLDSLDVSYKATTDNPTSSEGESVVPLKR